MPDTTGDYNRTMSKTVAVIGASSNRHKYGNKALRAFERQGYTVIPINPNEAEIEGHKAYATVLEVPGTIDMATVYVPPHKGVAIMDQLAAKGRARGVAQSRRRRRRGRRPGARARAQDHSVVQHRGDRGEPREILSPGRVPSNVLDNPARGCLYFAKQHFQISAQRGAS